jgi:hypothetical protein
MPPAVLIGLSAFALLSGPICGGIQWHHWNRDRSREFWARRTQPKREENAGAKEESVTA